MALDHIAARYAPGKLRSGHVKRSKGDFSVATREKAAPLLRRSLSFLLARPRFVLGDTKPTIVDICFLEYQRVRVVGY